MTISCEMVDEDIIVDNVDDRDDNVDVCSILQLGAVCFAGEFNR